MTNSENITQSENWLHDAEIWGDTSADIADFLERPLTFMTGKFYGPKDRRNTRDDGWKQTTLSLIDWINGDRETWGLAIHPIAKAKGGPSFCPSINIGGVRKDTAVQAMTALAVDVDSGTSLDHVLEKLEQAGIFAIVYTTFNHGSETLTLKHDEVVRKLGISTTPDLAQVKEYLTAHHGPYAPAFLDAVSIKDARYQTAEGMRIVLDVPAIDKFRVVVPLDAPVMLADLAPTMEGYKERWADAVTGFCKHVLDTDFDVTSTDINRLFYGPAHAAGGAFYSAIVMGQPLRFEDIKPYSKTRYVGERKAAGDPFQAGTQADVETFTAPSGADLGAWHRKYKERFLIADVLETYCSDRLRNVGGEKAGSVHVECPFEHEHSSSGGTATMAMNCDASEKGFWTVFCKHDACQGRHKLAFLEAMLAEQWFDESVLTDDGFLLPGNDEEGSSYVRPSGRDDKRSFYDPLFDQSLAKNGFVVGEGDKRKANAENIRAQMRQSMSEMFSFVIVEGGEARAVLRPSQGSFPEMWRDTGLSKAFKNRCILQATDGKPIVLDPAQEFQRDPLRKTYVGTQFEPDPTRAHPDRYNLWSGFKAEPVAGDWSLLRSHIRDQIIAGNGADAAEDEALFSWFMTWLADIFQHPGRKAGSAVGLLGEQGTGKSKLFDHIREAIGAPAVKIANRKGLVGNFNAQLDGKILAVAEEAFWSGDKEAAGTLKDLISSETMTIERKGIDAAERSNYLRFVFISNENWVIPTDDNADARRFFVIRVNNNKKKDAAFFAAVDAQMKSGGLEAMTHELVHWKPEDHGLTWGALRSPPHTAALSEQASYGLSGPKASLMSVIQAGEMQGMTKAGTAFRYDLSDDEPTPVLRSHLVAAIQGRDVHGGAAKATASAVKDLLGEDADKGDSKKGIEFSDPRKIDDLPIVEKGRWVEFPPLALLRDQLNNTYQ